MNFAYGGRTNLMHVFRNSAPRLARLCRCIVLICALLVPLSPSINGQQNPDPSLLEVISKIQAIDNHCHDLPAHGPSVQQTQPSDPVGKSTPFTAVPLRETNPEWIEAWQDLYGYKYKDRAPEHVGELLTVKERLIREKGNDYPAWVLDQTRIDIALVNAAHLGSGQALPRFRWVPFADGFLFPFDSTDPTGNIQRRRKEIGVDTPPTMWNDYLDRIKQQLKQWKANGAIAVKFTIAYYRSLEFASVPEADAKRIYEELDQDTTAKDYRTKNYRTVQDFLFRFVAREAGRAGLPVHIHTGEGGGPYFDTAGSNPLLLEPVLNDSTLTQTVFVLIHGGFPFDRQVVSLIKKPNVYADFSGQTFSRSARELSETLRLWLEWFPQKIFFGTDAFSLAPLRNWEEMAWLSNRKGRRALAIALTNMMKDGDITRDRAEEIARMVMRENAVNLYGLAQR